MRMQWRGCVCKGAVNRITPPRLHGWTSKFCGEVIGIDAAYPFVDTRNGISGKQFPELLVVSWLSRFAICSVVKDFRAVAPTSTLLNDWIRPIGIPWESLRAMGHQA